MCVYNIVVFRVIHVHIRTPINYYYYYPHIVIIYLLVTPSDLSNNISIASVGIPTNFSVKIIRLKLRVFNDKLYYALQSCNFA